MVGGMQWGEHVQGAAVVPQRCNGDAYLILAQGSLSVLVGEREGGGTRRVGHISPGDSFGEASFGEAVHQGVAEVRAAQTSSVMRVTRQDFHAAMKNWHAIQIDRKIGLLEKVPLFAVEDRRVLKAIAERTIQEKVQREQAITQHHL